MLPPVNIFTLRLHKYSALLVCLALLSTQSARGDFLVAYIKDPSIDGYILVADGLGIGQSLTVPGLFENLTTTHADTDMVNTNKIGDILNISYGADLNTWDVSFRGADAFDDIFPGESSISGGLEIIRNASATSTLDMVIVRQFQRTGTPTTMLFEGGGTTADITKSDVVFQSKLQSSADSSTPTTTDTLTIGDGDYGLNFPEPYDFSATTSLGSTTNPYYWLSIRSSFTLSTNETSGGLNMQSDVSGFSSVPEPSSITLLGAGFAATAAGRRWWKRRSVTRSKKNAVQ